jgi:hypothetical protein
MGNQDARTGELAQLAERSLCMRKVTDSISVFSTTFVGFFGLKVVPLGLKG